MTNPENRDYTPLPMAPNYNQILEGFSQNPTYLSRTWGSFSSFFSQISNSFSTSSLPNINTAGSPLLEPSDMTNAKHTQFHEVWNAHKEQMRSLRQHLPSHDTKEHLSKDDNPEKTVVLRSITVHLNQTSDLSLSDPSLRLYNSLKHLTGRLRHSLQKRDWEKSRTIQSIMNSYFVQLTTTRSFSPVGLSLEEDMDRSSNELTISDVENPTEIIEAIAHFPRVSVPPSLLLHETIPNISDTNYQRYKTDLKQWLDDIPAQIDQLDEQSRPCANRSLQAGKNALLWILAILKATSSAANIIGASPYSWYPYIAAPLNLCSTAMTRSRAILKADRTFGCLIPPEVQSLQLPSPLSTTNPLANNPPPQTIKHSISQFFHAIKNGECSVLVPTLLAVVSFSGILWDATMADKGWENTCEWSDNNWVTDMATPLRYPVTISAGLSALVFQWIKVQPTLDKLMTRKKTSNCQVVFATFIALIAATASVTQFWKLAEDSQEDNNFQWPLLFWVCALGKFSMSACAQIAKLLDALAKPWSFKRWNMFPEGILSIRHTVLCTILLADNVLAAGILTLTGTNQFLNSHVRSHNEEMTVSEDIFAILTMIVAFATQYVFAVIPASRQQAVVDHRQKARLSLFQHKTEQHQDPYHVQQPNPYPTPSQA